MGNSTAICLTMLLPRPRITKQRLVDGAKQKPGSCDRGFLWFHVMELDVCLSEFWISKLGDAHCRARSSVHCRFQEQGSMAPGKSFYTGNVLHPFSFVTASRLQLYDQQVDRPTRSACFVDPVWIYGGIRDSFYAPKIVCGSQMIPRIFLENVETEKQPRWLLFRITHHCF